MQEIEITTSFKKVLDLVNKTQKNIFLTGKAGTGKSTLLKYISQNTDKQFVTLAPTGLAAINIQGQTIHSFFKVPPGAGEQEAYKAGRKLIKSKVIQKLELLIIDEISMVRADLLDVIDTCLRTAKEDVRPFGGIQILMIGDLYQLPPVVRGQEAKALAQIYQTPYFFSSRVFNYLVENIGEKLEFIELTKIYRQTDQKFIDLLNKVRFRDLLDEDLEYLNNSVDPNWQDLSENHIILTTRNDQATQINQERLADIDFEEFVFEGSVEGDFKENNFPTDKFLYLKTGARVMFVKNASDGKWVNGTLGTIKDIAEEEILVQKDDGQEVLVYTEEWSMYKSEYDAISESIINEVTGTFRQFPLRLSWAITIHKSQGQTFERLVLDLGRGAFSTGQTYVALSRCTSFEGLVLARPIKKSDLRTDYKVSQFLTSLEYLLSNQKQPRSNKIELLQKAIDTQKTIEITYLKAKNVKSKRKIKPILIENQTYKGKDFLALEAYCLLREEDRVFNLDRIIEVKER